MNTRSNFFFKHNFREYEVFWHIFQSGSVTETAAYLEITQPAASQNIRSLEIKLNKKLFRREGGNLLPTLEACDLYKEINSAIRTFEYIGTKAWMDDDSKSLRIAANPSFSVRFLPPIVSSFVQQNKETKISLEISTDRVAQTKVLNGYVDFAVRFSNATIDSDLFHRPFIKSRSVCILPRDHRLASNAILTPELLSGVPQVAQCRRHAARTQIERAFSEAGCLYKTAVEVSANHLAVELVGLGVGISVINSFPVTQNLPDNVLIKNFEPSFTRFAVISHHRKVKLTPLANAFIEFLRESVIEYSHTELVQDRYEIYEDHLHY